MKTCTLVIHAPTCKVKQGARSFHQILAAGVGPGYAIYRYEVSILTIPGSPVVLLCKYKKLRAEGILVDLVKTTKTHNEIQRYDVHFKDAAPVPYKPEHLNRCGVAVI